MSTQLEQLNASLEAARAAAANAVPATTETAVSAPALVTPGRPVSMREMLAESTMSVKAYLKVSAHGFLIGKDAATLFDEIEVEFRLNAAKPFYGVRYGNPPVYKRSYDRIVESKSKRSWADVCAEAQRLDARCTGDYRGVDIPFQSVHQLKSKKGNEVLVEAGDAIGWTSSVTNFTEFQQFIEPYFKLMDNGQLAEDALVRGKISHIQRTKEGVQPWGALLFGDFTIVDTGLAQAA
jgi:hypothetical protein